MAPRSCWSCPQWRRLSNSTVCRWVIEHRHQKGKIILLLVYIGNGAGEKPPQRLRSPLNQYPVADRYPGNCGIDPNYERSFSFHCSGETHPHLLSSGKIVDREEAIKKFPSLTDQEGDAAVITVKSGCLPIVEGESSSSRRPCLAERDE